MIDYIKEIWIVQLFLQVTSFVLGITILAVIAVLWLAVIGACGYLFYVFPLPCIAFLLLVIALK